MISLLIAALSIVGFAGVLFLPLAISGMVEQFALTEAQAGRVASLHLFGIAIASIALATRIHRVDLRAVSVAAVVLAVVANALSAFAPSVAVLVVAQVLAGIGEGAVLAAVHALVARHGSVDRRAALSSLAVIIAGALLFPLLGPLFARYQATAVFGLATLLGLLLGWTALMIPGGRPDTTADRPGSADGSAGPVRGGTAALVAVLFFYVGEGALWGYVARIGAQTGMGSEAISNTLAYAFVVSIAGPVIAHFWRDRSGRILPIALSIVALCAVALVLGYVKQPAVFVVTTFVFYFVFVFGVVYSTSLVAALDPQGRLAAAVPGFRTVGTAAGPLVGSVALELSGFPGLGIVSFVCYVVAMGMFLSVRTALQPAAATVQREAR